ncbi:MBL fold metallo-hydrolase [Thermoplasma sp.]|uniref:MBL fold metallo-hydrolase n=1 Tax=Thermoplasma sp. TaxID=1973142 RepID=UPI0025D014EA|nr:MBL fold metallo-hydrolase [Thermoplasma sp.]
MQSLIQTFTVPIEIRALKTANIYRLESDDSAFLIDSGMSDASIRAIEPNLGRIDFVFVTHLHIDHLGGVLYLHEKYGIPGYMNHLDFDLIMSANEDREGYMRRHSEIFRINGVPPSMVEEIITMHPVIRYFDYYSKIDFIQDHRKLNVPGISFIDVPGHSPGSTAVYVDESHDLFAGDHILDRITPNIAVYGDEDDLGNYLDSLKKVKAMKVERIFPGHGNVITEPAIRIDEIERHHQERMHAMLSVLKTPKTAYDVAREISWSRGRKMDTMNFMERNFAILETVSHLKHMQRIGMVKAIEDSGIIKYSYIQ